MQRGRATTRRQIEHAAVGVKPEQNPKSLCERQATWMQRVAEQQPRPIARVQIGAASLDGFSSHGWINYGSET
jgi:hypothetical protein